MLYLPLLKLAYLGSLRMFRHPIHWCKVGIYPKEVQISLHTIIFFLFYLQTDLSHRCLV